MRTGQQLEAFSTTFGIVASVLLHGAALAYVASATASYDFDFELTLPAEVELGLTAEMEMGAPPAPPGATGAPDPRWSRAPGPSESSGAPDAGVPSEPSSDTDAPPRADAAEALVPIAPPTLSGPSRIPPGAQLALRVDMKRVRESPLAPDVTRFLRGVPDWQLLLHGSGIDPVADLDRILIATPNLQRSRLVLAGRHGRDRAFARRSVKRLAQSRGKPLRWRRHHGVAIAPWYNLDRTSRTIALLSPHHFSITRRQDLGRVLAMARARELRDPSREGLVVAHGPDALLSMGPDEALSLEVEGVHRFVIGNVEHLPIRMRLAIRETGPDEATVSVLATYPSDRLARKAADYWKIVATFYSEQLIMTLAGFAKTLRHLKFVPEGDRVRLSFTMNADQIRFALSYAEGRLRAAGSSRAAPTKKGP